MIRSVRGRRSGGVRLESPGDRQRGAGARPLLEAQAVAAGDAVFCARGTRGRRSTRRTWRSRPDDFRGAGRSSPRRKGIGLTVVGPEEPLVNGIVDLFQREGLRIFGPSRDAAELEGSKVFAKDLMRQAGIPTADYRVFRSAPDAEQYVLSREVSLVVRSRGRSTIRHTLMCRTAAEALEAIDRILDPREMLDAGRPGRDRGARAEAGLRHGGRGARLRAGAAARPGPQGRRPGRRQGGVRLRRTCARRWRRSTRSWSAGSSARPATGSSIEERLDGQEASILALTDGRTIIPLESSQDHKRAFDHDEGPNTGGMGAYSPTPVVTPELMEQVEREILVPVVHALKRARRAFRGVLYAGLMLTNQGPKVLEFNVRFGDPECQAVLMRLQSDLLDALEAVVDERLDDGRAGLGPAAGGDGGDGLGGLSRATTSAAADQQPGGGGPDARREGLPRRDRPADRPARRAGSRGSSPTAAGCWT